MFIHSFGAYFGLAVSLALMNKSVKESQGEGSTYHSDIFAMIGLTFKVFIRKIDQILNLPFGPLDA